MYTSFVLFIWSVTLMFSVIIMVDGIWGVYVHVIFFKLAAFCISQ